MATENQLFKIVGDLLTAGFAMSVSPMQNVIITKAAQSTQQGVPSGATVFMTKLPDYRYGSRGVKDVWVPTDTMGGGIEQHTETQQYESTFQLNCLVTTLPSTPDQPTAADLLNFAAYIMQSQATIDTLQAQGIGIERVTQVRNIPFKDDRDNFEYSPSFDFVLTHKQIVTTEIDVLQSTEFDLLVV